MLEKTTKNNPETIKAWCLYDWANSVFTLTITTVVFPIYFSEVTTLPDGDNTVTFFGWSLRNTVLYSYTLSAAFLIIAFINPLLSGIADYSGQKLRFMRFFTLLGAAACSGLFFFNGTNIHFGIILFGLGTIGYAGSLVFYNAFLTEIATPDQMDKISAKGYAYGYIGSVILLIINLIIILSPKTFGIHDSKLPSQIAFLSVGIWWFGFALLSFKGLPKDRPTDVKWGKIIRNGYKEVVVVFRRVRSNALISGFLISFFFYIMGFQTIMYFASLFAENELHLPLSGLIASMLLIQLIAILGARLFAKFSGKYGNLKVLLFAVSVCILVCISAYFIYQAIYFYLLAVVVGLIMGGIQSLSRSTFSKLIPNEEETASYFSFYELTEKVGIVLGTATYGLLLQWTGTMRNSSLGLVVFFLLGGLFLILLIRKSKNSDLLKGDKS
jgi:MFS transporter, UMF1 family